MSSAEQSVVALVEFVPKPGCLPGVLKALRVSQENSAQWDGCHQFLLTLPKDRSDIVVVIERWSSVEKHQRLLAQVMEREGFAQFRSLLSKDIEVRYLTEC